jgi:NADPH-dependent curcumin reductase CurA
MSNTTEGPRRSWVLRQRPVGMPDADTFELRTDPIPAPQPGQVVTRTLFLSIDPYMRGRISERKSYAPSIQPGDVMTGETVGEVIASADPHFVPGDIAVGGRGWQSHIVSPAASLTKLEGTLAPLSTYLGVLGMPGVTAYTGMTDIGQPKKGETVLISAASGAVGAVAGQLAKRAGAHVVGIAGGPEKCLYVQEQLGLDACIDHRADDLDMALAETCPNGVDVYFENVGGRVQQAAFNALNPFSRVIMCGMVAQYNDEEFPPGPNLGFVVGKRVKIQGMLVFDKPERFPEWRALATPWVLDGSFTYRETVVDGLENAPEALTMVLNGDNFGKMVVRVGDLGLSVDA